MYKNDAFSFAVRSALGEIAKRILRAASPATYRVIKGRLVESGVSVESKESPGNQRLARETLQTYLVNKVLIEVSEQKFGFHALFLLAANNF